MKKIILILCLAFFVFSTLSAGFEEDIKAFGKENGKNYIRPFVHTLSANLNNGWYNSAETGLLHFGFTINTMVALIPDGEQTFIATSPDTTIYQEDEIETATCFGDNGGTFHSNNPQVSDLEFPPGVNLKALPFAVPQAELGLPGGFGVQLRFLPNAEYFKEVGKTSLIGVGVKNEISKQFPLCPVAIALQASYQKFEMNNTASYSSIFVNLHASKSLVVAPISFFGGIGLENSTFEADYTLDNPVSGDEEDIAFEIKTENEIRTNVGARLKIMLVDMILEYSLGEYSSARFGLGFSL